MEISLDNFLNGKIKVYQPKKGYRAGIEAVLLAACVKDFKNCRILDVGSGVGIVSYCLAFRCNNIEIIGLEKNSAYYSLAIKSLKINKLKSNIVFLNKDFKDINNMCCDVIVSNPPWFRQNSTYVSNNYLINEAKIESLNLDYWVERVSNNLNLTGEYYTIFPYNRVKELTRILKTYFNIVKVYPMVSFKGYSAEKAIVYAKKSTDKYNFYEFDEIIIHKDDKSFMENIDGVLRQGSSLSLA